MSSNNTPPPSLLGPPRSYVSILDEHLLTKQQEENDGPRDRYPLRPSASGFCARLLAFDLNEYMGNARYEPEVRKASLIRLLNFGHSVEFNLLRLFSDVEVFQVKYKQQALSFFKLENAEHSKLIEGSIDFVIYSAEHKVIGDVKSKGDKYSSYRDSKWDETDDKLRRMKTVQVIDETGYWVEDLPAFLKELNDPFFEDNFIQLNLYAMNPFIQERGIDHAVIVQYNKNDSRLREVRFKPSQRVADYVKEKFEIVHEAIAVHKDPFLVEREYHLGSMRCAFCKRNKECYPDANAKKEFFSNLPGKDWPKDTDRLGALGDELEQAYKNYRDASDWVEQKVNWEQELIKLMDTKNVPKVRFSDGLTFELKFYKSPKPHLELKPSKP